KHYDRLTPEERFRLILAASARGDAAERDRLAKAGGRITLSMQDYAPHAHAFTELALLTFIELLDEAARYDHAFGKVGECRALFGGDDPEEREADADEDAGLAQDDLGAGQDEQSVEERYFRLALATGFVLRTKADGWRLFCERLNLP